MFNIFKRKQKNNDIKEDSYDPYMESIRNKQRIYNSELEMLIRKFNKSDIEEDRFFNEINRIKDLLYMIKVFKVDGEVKNNTISKGSTLEELLWHGPKKICFTSYEKASINRPQFTTVVAPDRFMKILKECVSANLELQINLYDNESITIPVSMMRKLLQKGDENGEFSMIIEDVFALKGRGSVVVGHIASGTINVGDIVQTIGVSNKVITARVTEMELFREKVNSAKAGDAIGILLRGIDKWKIKIGENLTKPSN